MRNGRGYFWCNVPAIISARYKYDSKPDIHKREMYAGRGDVRFPSELKELYTNTHTHTYIYIYLYICTFRQEGARNREREDGAGVVAVG